MLTLSSHARGKGFLCQLHSGVHVVAGGLLDKRGEVCPAKLVVSCHVTEPLPNHILHATPD